MALSEAYRQHLEVIRHAADDNALAVLECTDRQSGLPVPTLVAVGRQNGEYIFYPLAKLFIGNPYDELLSPTEVV